ncbi:MAG: Clp protease N-terminal domain-containing protein [Chloroflexota bacterium]
MLPPADRTLKDILVLARQIAAQQNHHYMGTEHLFVALAADPDRYPHNYIGQQGINPADAIAHIQRMIEPGDGKVLWEGHPHSPRFDVVLNLAHDIALEDGRENLVNEKDLWEALLEEEDNLPVHILRRMGM